jgi:hypothetical protein
MLVKVTLTFGFLVDSYNKMIKWLNYHHLLYFREIATEGTIVKASKKLNVGQSALSSQLKNLDKFMID